MITDRFIGWQKYFENVRAISSGWLEYYLDMVGVTGSSPVSPICCF
jgi:hypothetical protein